MRCMRLPLIALVVPVACARPVHPARQATVADIATPPVQELDTREWPSRLREEVPRDGLSGFALDWDDAPLFAAVGAETSVGQRKASMTRLHASSTGFAVSIVRDDGAWVEVESLEMAEREGHCGVRGGFDEFDGYALRFFVRKDDLAPVLGTADRHRHDDGSGLALAPGTPVELGADGLGVRVGGQRLPIRHAPHELALAYRVEPLPRHPDGLPSTCDLSVPARLLGEGFDLASLPWIMRGQCRVEEAETGYRVLLQSDCVQVEAVVEVDPSTDGPPDATGLGMVGTLRDAPYWVIDQGSATYWPDGTRAGTKRSAVATNDPPVVIDGRQCWAVGDALHVCHDEADVEAKASLP